jgi:DNA-directed RNA polymerase specialized sigma subunit
MRISEQNIATDAVADGRPQGGACCDRSQADWADQTRRVLTRDLLVRATRAGHEEGQALRFRALHLNLPLVTEISDRLGLSEDQRARIEHAALGGLHEALRLYDPFGDLDFATFATPYVEWQIRTSVRGSVLWPTRRRRPAVVRTISRRTARPSRR